MSKTKKIIVAALLLSTLIILSRFLSIKTPILRISLGFIPLMLTGILLGPKWSALIGLLGDLIGALAFPSGAYFPGYTLSCTLSGLIYGLFLYKDTKEKYTDKQFIIRLIISTSIVVLIIQMGLNTLWTYITSGYAVKVIAPVRIIKQLIMLPTQIIVIFILEKALKKPIDKYVRDA